MNGYLSHYSHHEEERVIETQKEEEEKKVDLKYKKSL